MEFPIFKTKMEGVDKKFDLTNPEERKEYFQLKAGPEIEKIKKHLEDNSFIVYLLGKKNSGKGTYAKMFAEIVGSDKVAHVSIGDVVREVHEKVLSDEKEKEKIVNWLKENYRGYLSMDEIIDSLLNRSTKTLLPTEFVLALVKREIDKMPKKSLFIDGFPRDLDQISYSLFFRDLVDYRKDPDIFTLISVPENVINERIKYRRICPSCKTSRNLKLLPSSKIGYDNKEKEFYLICDNPECEGKRMVAKEGDEQGIEPIRARLEKDEELIKKALSLYGIPKVLLRNSVPVEKAKEYIDDYEITPEYEYDLKENGEIGIIEKHWEIDNDQGVPSYSLMPPPVVVSMIKQMVEALKI
jgi:adenylate kinase family enzyme